VVIPWSDFKAAVWFPEDVLTPLNIIELPVLILTIESFVTLK
jgi:hypothetical protein